MKTPVSIVILLPLLFGAWCACGDSDTGEGNITDGDEPVFHLDGDTHAAEVGEKGGSCYSDKSCDPGLTCGENDICRMEAATDGDQPVNPDGDEESLVEDGDAEETSADGDEEITVVDGDDEAREGEETPDCQNVPDWPPNPDTDPWYWGEECRFPACDDDRLWACWDSSGLWTQTLTTLSHNCGAMAEAFNDRLKPGHQEILGDIRFNSIGECEYDGAGTLTGIHKGYTGINCSVSLEDDTMGGEITVLQTAVVSYLPAKDHMVGTARVFLFHLPMGTPDCFGDYEVLFERQN